MNQAYSTMHMRKSEIFSLSTTILCAEDAPSALKTSKTRITKHLRSSLTVKIQSELIPAFTNTTSSVFIVTGLCNEKLKRMSSVAKLFTRSQRIRSVQLAEELSIIRKSTTLNPNTASIPRLMTTLIEHTLEVYRDALCHPGIKLSGESASLNQLTPSADETDDVSEFRFAIHRSH